MVWGLLLAISLPILSRSYENDSSKYQMSLRESISLVMDNKKIHGLVALHLEFFCSLSTVS